MKGRQVAPKVIPSDYYDQLPESGHAPGDIWLNLPTYGVLKKPITAGVVVTPACDLQNAKSETVTYLPLLEIEEWLATSAWLTEVEGATQNALTSLRQREVDVPYLSAPTSLESIVSIRKQLQTVTDLDRKASELLDRASAGLIAMESILDTNCTRSTLSSLEILFGEKDWRTKRERLVSNALRSDLHFLPAIGFASAAHGGLKRHSVTLFRYPMSAPVDVLNVASDISLPDWSAALRKFSALPASHAFADHRPIRIARLTHRFCADLLTRYCMLYNRIGSPDFATATISRLASEIA